MKDRAAKTIPSIPGAVRGKYAARMREGFRVVEHDKHGDRVFDVNLRNDGSLEWKPVDAPEAHESKQ